MPDEDLRVQSVVLKQDDHIAETYCYHKLQNGARCLARIPAYGKPICSSCEAAIKESEDGKNNKK